MSKLSANQQAANSQFPYLELLNAPQRTAVEHGEGPLLIFAGAGSGKTRVLTHRIAHLIFAHGVAPHQILAVTFTNKAAREMKERVERLLAGRSLPVWVATFHSTCVRILRQHAGALNYTPQFVIYDSSDSLSLMKRVYKALHVDPHTIEPRQTLSMIDRAKNDYRFPEDLRKEAVFGRESTELIAQLYERYQQELREANAMDFGDLLCNTVTLFRLEPRLLEAYQDRFRYMLVDEYQDTNHVQYLFIKQLTGKHHNLCVVGDDDQSIYGFRGATVQTILNFREDYPEAKVVTLETNYRSTATILEAANSVIAKNTLRHPKRMITENDSGDPIVGYQAFDERDEAEFVVREISSLLQSGLSAKDIAIFYRTNAQSRAIEEELCESGLPYQIFGGHRFYERREIKDILAYLRLIMNPADNDAFLRVINTPARGIGAAAVGTILLRSSRERVPLLAALQSILTGTDASIPKAQRSKFQAFLTLVEHLQQSLSSAQTLLAGGDTPAEEASPALATLIHEIAERSGYLKVLREQESLEADGRIENIEELCRVSIDFVDRCLEQGARPNISDFLDRANLSSDLEQENTGRSPEERQAAGRNSPGEAISLMTLHLAKGLEFDVVFLVGLEEGLLPHVRSISNPPDLEEERRLCYVGMTRARKRLYLLRASNRQSFGRSNWYTGIPSRFLLDIPKQVVDDRDSHFLEIVDWAAAEAVGSPNKPMFFDTVGNGDDSDNF